MSNRRIYDDERHAQFITFSCYKRRKLLDTDHAKRIVIGTLGSKLAKHDGLCLGFVVISAGEIRGDSHSDAGVVIRDSSCDRSRMARPLVAARPGRPDGTAGPPGPSSLRELACRRAAVSFTPHRHGGGCSFERLFRLSRGPAPRA